MAPVSALAWDTTTDTGYGFGTSIEISDGCSVSFAASFSPTSSDPFNARVSLGGAATNANTYSGGARINSETGLIQTEAAITEELIESCGFSGVNVIRNDPPAATFAETAEMGLEFTGIRDGVEWRVTATAIGTADGQPVNTLEIVREGPAYPYVIIEDSATWDFVEAFGSEGDAWVLQFRINDADGSDTICYNGFLCTDINTPEDFTPADPSVTGVSLGTNGSHFFSWDHPSTSTFTGLKTVVASISARDITGPITIQIPDNVFRGQVSGELNVSSQPVTFDVPVTKPTVTLSEFVAVTDDSGNTAYLSTNMTVDERFLFDADDIGLTLGTLDLPSGSELNTGGSVVNDAGTYELRIMPTAEGQVSLNTDSAVFDGRGRPTGQADASNTITFEFSDAVRPTVELSEFTLNGVTQLRTNLTASEAVNLTVDDFAVENATISLLTLGNSPAPTANWVLLATPTADLATVAVTVLAEGAEDAAGNTNELASNTVTFDWDAEPPTATLSEFVEDQGILTTVMTVSENISRPSESTLDNNLTGGSLTDLELTSVSPDTTVWTITITPTGSGTVSMSVPVNALRDQTSPLTTNTEVSNTITFDYVDTTPPVVTLTEFAESTNNRIRTTATVTNGAGGALELTSTLVESALTITGGTFSSMTTGTRSSFSIFLTKGDGTTELFIDAGAFSDLSGNASTVASNTVTFSNIDVTPPSVTLGALQQQANGTYTSAVTVSESVTGFDVDDLQLTNATASLSGSGANYVITLTPQAEGELSVSVPAAGFADDAGNDNTVSNTVSATYVDTFPPEITLGALTAQGGWGLYLCRDDFRAGVGLCRGGSERHQRHQPAALGQRRSLYRHAGGGRGWGGHATGRGRSGDRWQWPAECRVKHGVGHP